MNMDYVKLSLLDRIMNYKYNYMFVVLLKVWKNEVQQQREIRILVEIMKIKGKEICRVILDFDIFWLFQNVILLIFFSLKKVNVNLFFELCYLINLFFIFSVFLVVIFCY